MNVPGLIKDHHKRTSRDDDKDPHLLHLGTSEAEVPVNTPSSVPNAFAVGSAPVPVWTWEGKNSLVRPGVASRFLGSSARHFVIMLTDIRDRDVKKQK